MYSQLKVDEQLLLEKLTDELLNLEKISKSFDLKKQKRSLLLELKCSERILMNEEREKTYDYY